MHPLGEIVQITHELLCADSCSSCGVISSVYTQDGQGGQDAIVITAKTKITTTTVRRFCASLLVLALLTHYTRSVSSSDQPQKINKITCTPT